MPFRAFTSCDIELLNVFFLGRQRRGGRGASDKEVTPPLLAKVQGNLEVNRTPALVEPISSKPSREPKYCFEKPTVPSLGGLYVL